MSDLFSDLYNPDILTCLASLSNDEVFTPPDVANAMLDLLPQELFKSKETTFLDPAVKSGVFLREIAKRLIKGLEDEIPDLQERLDHIYHKQIFGIAITELTSLLARRSLYCSKYPNGKYSISHFDDIQGNIRFKNTEHNFKDGRCTFCGASEEVFGQDARGGLESHAYEFIHTDKPEEILNMKFDVIISNPPYQMDDGGAQASAKPIYNDFVTRAKKLLPRYVVMIIPARWYTGGKNLDAFRDEMLNDKRIRVIHDYINAANCFPGVEIKGGVCYFLWNRDSSGDCAIITHRNDQIVSSKVRPLLEDGADTFIRYNEAVDIVKKIKDQNEQSFASIVHPAMTFGLRTFFKTFDSETSGKGLIKLYANHSQGYVKVDKIAKGGEYINTWKVYIPEAVGSGDMSTYTLKPILGEPNTASTETYIMNGPYSSKQQAENAITYIHTKFFHFLLGLKKITQHTTNKTYGLIPLQDFSKPWTDAELYEKYGLTQEEIDFIESMIRPMNEETDD